MFTAKFDSNCGSCKSPIKVGDKLHAVCSTCVVAEVPVEAPAWPQSKGKHALVPLGTLALLTPSWRATAVQMQLSM